MNLVKLLIENCKSTNIDIEKFNTLSDKQIVNNTNLSVSVFKVNYSCTTIRGNPKKHQKYFIVNGINPQMDMRKELDQYINNFNNKNPHRKLSNVKFLDSQCEGYLML